MTETTNPSPELSRPVPLSRLNRGPVALTVEARPDERRAMARRFGLVSLDRLVATLRLSREADQGDIRLCGHIEAAVTRQCVVTLEPFAAPVASEFQLRYVVRPADLAGVAPIEEEVECDLEGEDIEPITSETVDVGEAVAQYFYLSLDPYPRAPDAPFEIVDDEAKDDGEAEACGPFAALTALHAGLGRS